jgi:hypothetical protein
VVLTTCNGGNCAKMAVDDFEKVRSLVYTHVLVRYWLEAVLIWRKSDPLNRYWIGGVH